LGILFNVVLYDLLQTDTKRELKHKLLNNRKTIEPNQYQTPKKERVNTSNGIGSKLLTPMASIKYFKKRFIG
jgi:hypothetical protein